MMKSKKTVAKMLLVAFVFSLVLPASVFAADTKSASDLNGHWAQTTIQQWMNKGLIGGYEDGTFQPDRAITRAEFIKLVNKAIGANKAGVVNFTDVSADDWFYGELQLAMGAGYVGGFEDGTFRPNDTVTRAQAAAFIAKAKNLANDPAAAARFMDNSAIADWAKGAVGAAAKAGYIGGYQDGTFQPDKALTRAEAVSMLDRVLNHEAQAQKDDKKPVAGGGGSSSSSGGSSGGGGNGGGGGSDPVVQDYVYNNGDLTIMGKNVTITSTKLNGADTIRNLTVNNGVQDFTLEGITITGTTTINGGSSNSIHFKDCQLQGQVILNKQDVHISLEDGTSVSKEVIVQAPAALSVAETVSITETIETWADLTVRTGTVPEVQVTKQAVVTTQTGANIAAVEVATTAPVTVKADVETVKVNKANAAVTIESTVKNVSVTQPATVTVAAGGQVTTVAAAVDSGKTVTVAGEGKVGGVVATAANTVTVAETVKPATGTEVTVSTDAKKINLTVNGGDVMTTLPAAAKQNTEVSFTVVPKTGYEITSVLHGESVLTATGDVYSFTMGNADTTVTINTATQPKWTASGVPAGLTASEITANGTAYATTLTGSTTAAIENKEGQLFAGVDNKNNKFAQCVIDLGGLAEGTTYTITQTNDALKEAYPGDFTEGKKVKDYSGSDIKDGIAFLVWQGHGGTITFDIKSGDTLIRTITITNNTTAQPVDVTATVTAEEGKGLTCADTTISGYFTGALEESLFNTVAKTADLGQVIVTFDGLRNDTTYTVKQENPALSAAYPEEFKDNIKEKTGYTAANLEAGLYVLVLQGNDQPITLTLTETESGKVLKTVMLTNDTASTVDSVEKLTAALTNKNAVTLAENADITASSTLTISQDKTLIIPAGAKLSIAEGGTITNNGTIIINDEAGLALGAKVGGNITLGSDIKMTKGLGVKGQAFEGTLDGAGHTIDFSAVSGAEDGVFAADTAGAATIKNLTLQPQLNGVECFVGNTHGTSFTYDNVVVGQAGQVCQMTGDDNNESAYLAFSTATTTTFKNCTNNLSYICSAAKTYTSAFLGGYAYDSCTNLVFENCTNNGNLTMDYASLYVGNGSNMGNVDITIRSCTNNGSIMGTVNAAYVAAISHDKLKKYENNQDIEDIAKNNTSGSGKVAKYSADWLKLTQDSSTGAITISAANAPAEVASYNVSYSAYAKAQNESQAIATILINYTIESASLEETLPAYQMIDKTKAEAAGITLNEDNWIDFYYDTKYQIVEDPCCIVVDFTNCNYNEDNNSFDLYAAKPEVTVTAVDKDGNPLAIAKLSYQKEPAPITPKVEAAMRNLTLPATDEEQPIVTDENAAAGKDDNSTTDDKDNSNINKGSAEGSGQDNGEQDPPVDDPEQPPVEE